MNKRILTLSFASLLALSSFSVSAAQIVKTSEKSGYVIEDNNKNGLDHDQVGGGD